MSDLQRKMAAFNIPAGNMGVEKGVAAVDEMNESILDRIARRIRCAVSNASDIEQQLSEVAERAFGLPLSAGPIDIAQDEDAPGPSNAVDLVFDALTDLERILSLLERTGDRFSDLA